MPAFNYNSFGEGSSYELQYLRSNTSNPCGFEVTASSKELKLSTPEKEQLQTSTDFSWLDTLNPFQRIEHLKNLPPNWDGYGSLPFQNHQISNSRYIVNNVYEKCKEKGLSFSDYMPFVAPSSDGTVLLEWAGKRFQPIDKELEVFILRKGDESECQFLKVKCEIEDEGRCSVEEVLSLFDWLITN